MGSITFVTDRWQTFTDVVLNEQILKELAGYSDEFLVHGVDVEGKAAGVDKHLAELLGRYHGNPVTYAGGSEAWRI